MSDSLLGHTEPDPAGTMLGTGYMRFESPIGIVGLAKWNDTRLDLLAVFTDTPGKGQFRHFIAASKKRFKTICVWEIWNQNVSLALQRYGFTPDTEIAPWGEAVSGLRWDAP